MKKIWIVYLLLIACFALYVLDFRAQQSRMNEQWRTGGLRGEIGEKYVMVTFQMGIDYWKSGLKGFEDAAQALNVSVEYRGSTQRDVHEQITVLEQVIAKKPAGIAISAIHPSLLTATINKAVDAGIPVVLFDSDAPGSKAYSFLGTDNYAAGVEAARKMAELTGGQGEVAVVTTPNQQNHQERTNGFADTIAAEFPRIRIVDVKNGKGDQLASRQAAEEILRAHPGVGGIFATEANGGIGVAEAVRAAGGGSNAGSGPRIISFDTDKGTLDLVKSGDIAATMAQGTWNMGYWSLQFLFSLKHGLGGSSNPGAPRIPKQADTGITVVTQQNVDDYYAK
ncbi:substrate-binding domain-containing protein [Paenibacillus macerans]|uniref:Sugar ABC transporter n=1 Tax=Paenibacillus macerans TaxID=44252 RepID=A0A090ZJG4_PAEMA|nr:substrate-binding domain-containing protein [Paenibacillus macerans]KFN11479.1 sugar ABC transporter [Paenibacillus macerans]MBS5913854.1 substrate-binding domain-containing protein [Paenibacillus macerans]MCY7558573.1 substrate-binding domain-containing protein [Paenibacillus macerans]MEC0136693.1 substrate-binding domain-containing protein [Paenibacillus macerans]MEC0149398.1 substrate-binding domain-containing protein [Paenibacillus macerans]